MGSANTDIPNTNQLAVVTDTSIAALMMNLPMLAEIDNMAKTMSTAAVSVPNHFRGKIGDCYAVCLQAIQWGMNPFAVASKTFVSPDGKLGYEGQLVNAVLTTLAPIKGRPKYEFIGDWSKVRGKVKKMEKAAADGKKATTWFARDWNDAAEVGLGVIVSCTLQGEDEPREITVMMSQCQPRFSTQWATDPEQQICYIGIRKWARRYCPDVILGVYTQDELDDNAIERDITPAGEQPGARSAQPETKPYSEADMQTNLPKWRKAIEGGKQTPSSIIKFLKSKHIELTEEQVLVIESLVPIPGEAETVDEPGDQTAAAGEYADQTTKEFFENENA